MDGYMFLQCARGASNEGRDLMSRKEYRNLGLGMGACSREIREFVDLNATILLDTVLDHPDTMREQRDNLIRQTVHRIDLQAI